MNAVFKLRVFSPLGRVIDAEVSSVRFMSAMGELEILSQHCKYTGIIGTGVMAYATSENPRGLQAVISGGFASIEGNNLTILADSVDLPEATLGHSQLKSERPELEKAVKEQPVSSVAWEIAQAKLKRLDALEQIGHR